MFLLFPLMLAGSLVTLAASTSETYLALFRSARCQIAADNALITIGKWDRRLFFQVLLHEKKMQALHSLHHALHACARNPLTAWKCASADLAMEKSILGLQNQARLYFSGRWTAHSGFSSIELQKLKVGMGHWTRSRQVPIHTIRCSVCGFPKGWKVDWANAFSEVSVCAEGHLKRARIEWVERQRNYRLTR